jgi:hypothetical protein
MDGSHAHRGTTLSRYAKGYTPKQLLEALDKLEYGIEEELQTLPKL